MTSAHQIPTLQELSQRSSKQEHDPVHPSNGLAHNQYLLTTYEILVTAIAHRILAKLIILSTVPSNIVLSICISWLLYQYPHLYKLGRFEFQTSFSLAELQEDSLDTHPYQLSC